MWCNRRATQMLVKCIAGVILASVLSSPVAATHGSASVAAGFVEGVSSTLVYNGIEYASLNGKGPNDPYAVSNQGSTYVVPSGWAIASQTDDLVYVCQQHKWGAGACVVAAAGTTIDHADVTIPNALSVAVYTAAAGVDFTTSASPGSIIGPSVLIFQTQSSNSWQPYFSAGGYWIGSIIIMRSAVCSEVELQQCSPYARCGKDNGIVTCTCHRGFDGDGAICTDVAECELEEKQNLCHHLAYCIEAPGSFSCVCPEGFLGDGLECSNNAWGIRSVLTIPGVGLYSDEDIAELKLSYAGLITGNLDVQSNSSIVQGMPHFAGVSSFGDRLLGVVDRMDPENSITLHALFKEKTEAEAALGSLANPDWSILQATVVDGPAIYRWTGGSTSDPLDIGPSGLTIVSVSFNSSCMSSGCWVVEVTYTAGTDDFNVFYVPKADASDALSYDPVYTTDDDTWPKSPANTFLAANHPCTSMDYDPSSGTLPASVTACCIPEFLAMYRPVSTFSTTSLPDMFDACSTGERDRAITRTTATSFVSASSSTPPNNALTFAKPTTSAAAGAPNTIFVDGVFSGMTLSRIDHKEVVDSYIGIYKATIQLDEVELRTLAGQLKGTPGVEHTVDTFIGLVNFSPTGSTVLDASATQVAIHLEKTSFFSVSTHGTNDYTFLQYVNLRLVAVYLQDNNFAGTDEASLETVRTDSTAAAHYVQVTFTMGAQYDVNDPTGAGLIPLDSVRAGQGAFFDDSSMIHKCSNYVGSLGSFASPNKDTFDARFNTGSPDFQDCAPAASMCISPTTVPDQFVSFNIPLGIDWFPTTAADLSANVFVDLVVNAEDTGTSGPAPNDGGEAKQMKTTLTASIPVVAGGVNIFCDGVVAKTDLKDVADADLIIGSATDLDKLSRLTIFENIASTNLDEVSPPEVDTDSIESGLMTLVIKGNASYFSQNTGTSGYSLELEDVITVHIMEDNACTGTTTYTPGSTTYGCVFDEVKAMAAQPAEENDGAQDGYKLNDAFAFRINRPANRAHLEPTPELLDICSFNPPRPASGSLSLETCIVRRDVRMRGFPARVGGHSTAMEILVREDEETEATFMTTVLGASAYAKGLGRAYATAVGARYAALGHTIDGRYNRAFWINPGYEWAPTQTGSESIFTLSQKIFMFALINLNENYVDPYALSCDAYPAAEKEGDKCFFSPATVERTWDGAQAYCANPSNGWGEASLAVITSDAENTAARKVATANSFSFSTGPYFYIGAKMDPSGTWKQPDGTTDAWLTWNTGEPNEGNGGTDCINIYPESAGITGFNDLPCTWTLPFVCSGPVGRPLAPPLTLPSTSRRMLLSTDGSGAGVGAASMSYKTSPKSMMASAFNVPEHRVATFKVNVQLTAAEACMSPTELQASLRSTLDDYLSTTASSIETVQVTGLAVDKGSEECEDPNAVRRSKSIRKLLSSFSSATAEVNMLLVFSPGTTATINLPELAKMPGIEAVDAVDVAAQVEVSEEYVNPNPGKKPSGTPADSEDSESSKSGGSREGLIAGVCGGVGLIAVLAGAAFVNFRRKAEAPAADIQSAVSIVDLKAQLQNDV